MKTQTIDLMSPQTGKTFKAKIRRTKSQTQLPLDQRQGYIALPPIGEDLSQFYCPNSGKTVEDIQRNMYKRQIFKVQEDLENLKIAKSIVDSCLNLALLCSKEEVLIDIMNQVGNAPKILAALAENPNTPQEILRKLSYENTETRWNVAKNPSTTQQILLYLSQDDSSLVRRGGSL